MTDPAAPDDMPFSQLHADRAGIPAVLLPTRCRKLPRLGEETRVRIRPARVGSRSAHFESFLVGADRCLIRTTQVIVFTKLERETLRSVAVPEASRARLLQQLAGHGSG